MLVKMRSVRTNTNMFTCSFYARRSQNRKKQLELTVFFALLGSSSVKAASKMLVKLTPGVGEVRPAGEIRPDEPLIPTRGVFL